MKGGWGEPMTPMTPMVPMKGGWGDNDSLLLFNQFMNNKNKNKNKK